MPKQPLPRIPDDFKNLLYDVLCDFGCARRRALVKYACIVIENSEYINDEYKPRAVEIADQAIQSLSMAKRILTMKYATENIVVPTFNNITFETLDAFEAFVAVVEELNAKGFKFWTVHATTAGHPYDFVIGTPETTYRMIVYNTEATAKINFMNVAYDPKLDRDFTTLFVITEAYMNEDFSNLKIKGRYRLAFIAPDGKDKMCLLGDIIGKEITKNDQVYI